MDRSPNFLSCGVPLERLQVRYPFLWDWAAFNTLPSYGRLSLNQLMKFDIKSRNMNLLETKFNFFFSASQSSLSSQLVKTSLKTLRCSGLCIARENQDHDWASGRLLLPGQFMYMLQVKFCQGQETKKIKINLG